MIKQLKYLISFLIILGLTVTDYVAVAQESNAHQPFSEVSANTSDSDFSRTYIYDQPKACVIALWSICISYFTSQEVHTITLPIHLKNQRQLFQKIRLTKATQVFFPQLNTTHKTPFYLYMA